MPRREHSEGAGLRQLLNAVQQQASALGWLPVRELAPADLPDPAWSGLTLSTIREHASPTTSPGDEDLQFCPTHHIAKPVIGMCDDCQ